MPTQIKVGDKVKYVPAQVHARQQNRQGDFPWVFGWKTGKRVRQDNGSMADEVIELNHGEAAKKLDHIRKQAPDRQVVESAKLVFIRPNALWSAEVRAVNLAEGRESADLEVLDPTSGSVLHYSDVPITDNMQPHTCHAA